MSKRSPDRTESGRYIAITAEMEQLADQIRDAFLTVRRSFVPGAGGVSAKSRDQFLLAAQLCQQMEENPVEFVTRQIEEAMAVGAPLYPQILTSRKLAVASRDKGESKLVDSVGRYKFQLELLRQRSTIFAPEVLLRDPSQPFSPLFRYCMGVKLGLADVMDRNKAEASLELAADPVARDVFGQEVAGL
jgi:hypothetical protein